MTDTHSERYADTGGLIDRLHIEVTHISAERTTASMPVEGNRQPFGLLHGGATAALAETVGSLAAIEHAGEGRFAVGVDLSITHHRAMRGGTVTAVATPLHLGGSVATYHVAVVDESDTPVATARLTCLLRDVRAT